MKKKQVIIIVISTCIILSGLIFFQRQEKIRAENELISEQYYTTSQRYYRQKDYLSASSAIKDALRYNKNEKNYILKLLIDEMLINIDDIIDDLNNLIKLKPNKISYLNKRGQVFYNKKIYDKAIVDFEESLKKDSSQVDIMIMLIDSSKELKKYDLAFLTVDQLLKERGSKEDYMLGIDLSSKINEYNKVIAYCESYLKKEKDSEIYSLLGNTYYLQKDYLKAFNTFKLAKQNNFDVMVQQGYCLFNLKRYEESSVYLKKALNYKDDKDIRDLVAYCQSVLIKGDQTIDDKGDQTIDDIEDKELNKELSYYFYNQKDYPNAIQYIEKYIKETNDNEVYFYLGNCYNLNKNANKAIQYYTLSIQANRELGNSRYNRGLLYLEAKEYEKAIEDFGKSYELNNKPDYSIYNQGVGYMSISKFKESTQCFLKVVEISEDKELVKKAKDILSRYYVT